MGETLSKLKVIENQKWAVAKDFPLVRTDSSASPESIGSTTDLPEVETPSSPSPTTVTLPAPTTRRMETYLQSIGLEGSLAPEGTWLGVYDNVIGGRSLFFGPEEAGAGNFRLNLHWGSHGFDLFNSFNFTRSSTAALSEGVSITRLDAEMGFTEYGKWRGIGTRGSGFYAGTGGVSRAGLGIGAVELSGGSPSQPHERMLQIRLISDGDHLTLGYGPVELGLRLFEASTAITLGDGAHVTGCSGAHCSESDWIPSTSLRGPVFSLRYYFNRPAPHDPVSSRLDPQEFAFHLTDINMGRFGSFYRGESMTNIILGMGLLQAWTEQNHDVSEARYGQALTGLFLNSVYNGSVAGAEATGLEDLWRRSNGLQRGVSMGLEGAWILASGIGWAARGSYPTPEELAQGNRGAFDSPAGNSFRMMFPRQVATDGLALLGYSGALGGEKTAAFHVSNSILTLFGLGLVLFARPLSGNGNPPDSSIPDRPQEELPHSLLGDYGGTFEGARSYDLYANNFYDSKENEIIVTEIGSTAVSYALNRWLRPSTKTQTSDALKGGSSQGANIASAPGFNISFSGGDKGVMLRFGGII